MQKFISTLATAAAAAALMAGLWQDWSLLSTLKRMLLGYLGFFFLGSVMVLAIRIVPLFDRGGNDSDQEVEKNMDNPEPSA